MVDLASIKNIRDKKGRESAVDDSTLYQKQQETNEVLRKKNFVDGVVSAAAAPSQATDAPSC